MTTDGIHHRPAVAVPTVGDSVPKTMTRPLARARRSAKGLRERS